MKRELLKKTINMLWKLNSEENCKICGLRFDDENHQYSCDFEFLIEILDDEFKKIPDSCPFCKNEPKLEYNENTCKWSLICPNCEATQLPSEDKAIVIERWNWR